MNPAIEPVLDEISAVLKKHDMVGLIIVGNPTHVDWRMKIDASWSCAWLEDHPDGIALRIKSKLVDYPNLEAQKQCMERTVGTFVTFQHTLTKLNEQLDKVLMMISKSVNFLGRSRDET